jgi:hypothetical protein
MGASPFTRRRSGCRRPGLYLTNLVYADDIVLLAPSFEAAQRRIIVGLHWHFAHALRSSHGVVRERFVLRLLGLRDADLGDVQRGKVGDDSHFRHTRSR